MGHINGLNLGNLTYATEFFTNQYRAMETLKVHSVFWHLTIGIKVKRVDLV